VPRPSDIDAQHAFWDYRWTLVRALAAADGRRPHEARRHLKDAADQIRSSPRRLLDADVLLGFAALAYHAEDHRRAAEILATFRGNVRTPASFAVYAHYRSLLKDRLSKPERTEILHRAAHLDPTEVLARELARRPPSGSR
jgi:thioredoxin-like negative regulator of GroEL